MEQTITVSKKVPHSGYKLKIHDIYQVKNPSGQNRLVAFAFLKETEEKPISLTETVAYDSCTVQLPLEKHDLPVEVVIVDDEKRFLKETRKYEKAIELCSLPPVTPLSPLPSAAKTVPVEETSLVEKTIHVVSFGYPKCFELIKYWDQIDWMAKNLFLSRLPMRGEMQGIIDYVKTLGAPLKLVVSVVKDYEINQSLPTDSMPLMDPIRPEEWEKVGIMHRRVAMPDFGSKVDAKEAASNVMFIQQVRGNRDDEGSALVHCKAGRSRSAMIVSCVIAAFDIGQYDRYVNKSPKELINIAVMQMMHNRIQVKMSDTIKNTAVTILTELQKMLQASSKGDAKKNQLLKDKINEYFSDPLTKGLIKKMETYTKLIEYRNGIKIKTFKAKPQRVRYIDELFDSIDQADDATWYINLYKFVGPAHELISASPFFNVMDPKRDKVHRKKLIENFINEVEVALCASLDCPKKEVQSFFGSTKSENKEHKSELHYRS